MNSLLKWRSSSRRMTAALALILTCTLCNSCKIKLPTNTVNCTYLLSGLFTTCYSPLNTTKRIPYKVTISIYTGSGFNRLLLDTKTVTVAAGGANSVSIVAKNAPFGSVVDIEGTAQALSCSTCAETQDCTQLTVPTGIKAAEPTLFSSGTAGGGFTTVTINQ